MRLRDTIILCVFILTAIGLLIAAGSQLDFINSNRLQMKLISNEPLENAPPSLAFATVAMGAFRGLVVDVLWMRADRLKEQNQFFDAKQLAEWITILQPRFAQVWEFHAWNMAYNISAACHSRNRTPRAVAVGKKRLRIASRPGHCTQPKKYCALPRACQNIPSQNRLGYR
jgi:hypothetical protein